MNRRRAYSRVYRNPKVFNARERKRSKRRSGFLRKLTKILFLIALIAGLYIFLTTDYLAIKNVRIKGTVTFPSRIEEIAKKELEKPRFLLFKNNNFFLLNSSRLKNAITKEIKEIKSVTITRKFPDSIEVSITEKKAKLGWETGNKRFLLDEDGFVLKETENFENLPFVKDSSNLPVSNDKRVVYPNFVKFIEELNLKIKNLNINVEYIEIKETTFIINVITKEGFRLVFDTTKTLEDQIKKLEETLKQIGEQRKNLEYIDLTAKNKSIYKFK